MLACPLPIMCITSTPFLSRNAEMNLRWQYLGFTSMHMMHTRFFSAISKSRCIPSLKSFVLVCFLYPPRRYPPSSSPNKTYSTPFSGSHFPISSLLKCSTLEVGKRRMSAKTWISCSLNSSKNFSTTRLLCPTVHTEILLTCIFSTLRYHVPLPHQTILQPQRRQSVRLGQHLSWRGRMIISVPKSMMTNSSPSSNRIFS